MTVSLEPIQAYARVVVHVIQERDPIYGAWIALRTDKDRNDFNRFVKSLQRSLLAGRRTSVYLTLPPSSEVALPVGVTIDASKVERTRYIACNKALYADVEYLEV
jgi:hypothetical protein